MPEPKTKKRPASAPQKPKPVYNSELQCLPILTAKNIEAAKRDNGDVCGTLTIVRYGDKVVLVAANHVLRRWGHTFLYSPLRDGYGLKALSTYSWQQVTDGVNTTNEDRIFDLAFAILTTDEQNAINQSLISELRSVTTLEDNFTAVITGYRVKGNNRHDIRRHGQANADFFEAQSLGIEIDTDKDTQQKLHTGRMTFHFSRKKSDSWSGDKLLNVDNKAPKPKGVSGGPVYLHEENQSDNDQKNIVVGFLIEQCDSSKDATAVISDVLIEAAGLTK